MSRVSAKTDNGNQVPKCGRVNSFRPSDVLSSSELSAASAVTLMATTLACGCTAPGSTPLIALGRSESCHSRANGTRDCPKTG